MSMSPAWSGSRPVDEGEARTRVLDAASGCIERSGVAGTSLTSIARAAGVTRPTIYSYFSGRDEIISRTLERAADRYAERLAAFLERFSDPQRIVVEAVVYSVRELPGDPVLGRMIDTMDADPVVLANVGSEAAIGVTRRGIRPLARRMPQLAERDLAEIAELLARLVLSFLAGPRAGRSETELRAFLRRRVAPALGLPPRSRASPER